MADNKDNTTTAGSFMSIQMGGDDGPQIKEGTQDGLSDADVLEGVAEDVPDDAADPDDTGGDEPEADASEGESEGDDLGEFDPENLEAWNAKYAREDGNLNEEVLTAEWDANGGEGLKEETYKYLESRGISKTLAQQVEAAFKTQRDAAANAANDGDLELMTVAGGPEPLKAALDWGKSTGYDKAAQDRFNKVMEGKDPVAKKEAVELLMARYAAANPEEKPAVPKRDVTKQGGTPSRTTVKPFKDLSEYRAAVKAAGDNQAKVQEAARRRKASGF